MGLDHTPAPASCCRDFGEWPRGLAGTPAPLHRIPICGTGARACVCARGCASAGLGVWCNPRLGLAWAPCTPKASVAVPVVGCQRVPSPLSLCTRCSRVGVASHAHAQTLSKHTRTPRGSLNATAAHPPCARWRWHVCGCVARACAPPHARRDACQPPSRGTALHLCAPLCWCEWRAWQTWRVHACVKGSPAPSSGVL